jgi:hypothetical protein
LGEIKLSTKITYECPFCQKFWERTGLTTWGYVDLPDPYHTLSTMGCGWNNQMPICMKKQIKKEIITHAFKKIRGALD